VEWLEALVVVVSPILQRVVVSLAHLLLDVVVVGVVVVVERLEAFLHAPRVVVAVAHDLLVVDVVVAAEECLVVVVGSRRLDITTQCLHIYTKSTTNRQIQTDRYRQIQTDRYRQTDRQTDSFLIST